MKWLFISILLLSAGAHAEANPRYPKEIRLAFLDRCVGLSKELVEPCKCILTGLETHIPYEEFAEVIKLEDPMLSPKVKAVAQQCAFKASEKQAQ